MQKEFIAQVNQAIESQRHVDDKDHAGEEMTIILPAPSGFCSNGINLSEINLDNAKISIFDGREQRDESGNVIFNSEMFPPAVVLYQITGATQPDKSALGRCEHPRAGSG